MYIFGGKDEDNNKLNDIWMFDFSNYMWQLVEPQSLSYFTPTARSGHSACLYRDYMVIFGGIHEVTKELNDLCVFDLKQKKWVQFFEELNSPAKVKHGGNLGSGGNSGRKYDASPASNKKKNSFMISQVSKFHKAEADLSVSAIKSPTN